MEDPNFMRFRRRVLLKDHSMPSILAISNNKIFKISCLIAYEAEQPVNLCFKACRIMRASDLI
jgi:hypothetical protein